MKVLVTGASGFLGRRVVAEFLRRGHRVRAMVRPSTNVDVLRWKDQADIVRADLRIGKNLLEAFDGVDALVHLAAAVTEPKETLFSSTVVGTERLLDAMARSQTRRLVLASSFAIYDWSKIHDELTENSPLEENLYERDEYTIAKYWQESVARAASERYNWDLTVLRPGLIWGQRSEHLPAVGPSVGRTQLVVGPLRRLPLTHVDNCADCFVTVTEDGRSIGETYNLVDGHNVSAWRYAGEQVRRSSSLEHRLPVPYWAGWIASLWMYRASKLIFHGKGKLPSLFIPCRYEARFMRVRMSNRKLRETLGWRPPLSFDECLRQADDAQPVGRERQPKLLVEISQG